MWVKYTPDEFVAITAKRKTDSDRLSFFVRVSVAVLLCGLFLFVPRSSRRFGFRPALLDVGQIHGFSQVLKIVGVFLAVAGIAALPFWKTIFASSASKRRAMVCMKCEACKFDDGDDCCSCGGEFVPADTVK